LRDAKRGEKVFFFVRDPIDRFVSGFYSRKRKGMPRIYNEWSGNEREAFNNFKTPNELGLALSNKNRKVREQAIKAMQSIGHVNTSYWDWFKNRAYFMDRMGDILLVGEQRKLGENFLKLKELLGLPEALALPKDRTNTHKNPENVDKNISPKARKNLEKYYSKDYEFLALLKQKKLY